MKNTCNLVLLFTFFTLVTSAQSKLIGTNRLGGNGYGTIYKYTAGDTSLSDVLKIKGTSIFNTRSLVKIGQCFYGVDYSGGGEGLGSLFKYNLTSKTFTILHHFSRDSGATPFSRLLHASNGKLYGSTFQGGIYNRGTIFEFDPTTGNYLTILNCDSISGSQIHSDLIQASNGKIYISTTHYGNNGFGAILELDLNSMSIQKIYDYTAIVGTSGGEGVDFTESINGTLVGFAPNGGLNNFGLIFEFDLNTHIFSAKFNFDSVNGVRPVCATKVSSSKLLGATYDGGSNNCGVLFEYDFILDTYTKIFDFTGLNGKNPSGKMINLANGKFYGTTFKGGTYDRGVIYEYSYSTNSLQKLHDFEAENFTLQIQLATDNIGNLYGSQEWQAPDSIYQYLFKYNLPTGKMGIEAYFGLNDGNDFPGGFVLASNGKYYAATYKGGKISSCLFYCGAIIEYDYNSNSITKKLDFTNDSIGFASFSSMVHASNGKIYGITSSGAANDEGALFEYDYLTNTISKKHDFSSVGGYQYSAGGWLMEATNGKIYGTCNSGGPFGLGTLYEYDFASDVFTTKINFNDTIGSEPKGGIVQAANGKLYTTVSYGGPSGNGGIIEYNLITDSAILKLDFQGTGVTATNGSLIEIGPNKLYGLSLFGGANNQGAIFEYDCNLNQISILYDFTIANGTPTGSLLHASNGKLYGATVHNASTLGGLFEFDIATSTYSQKVNWNTLETGWRTGNKIIEVGCIAPGILASGPTSFCLGDSVVLSAFGSNANTFQWNRHGIAIPGAVSQNLVVKSPGRYSVTVTDTICTSQFTSNAVRVRVPCIPPIENQNKIAEGFNEQEIYLYYNAGNQYVEIYANDLQIDTYRIMVADATGRVLINQIEYINNSSLSKQINCTHFATGIYIVKIITDKEQITRKFVKEY